MASLELSEGSVVLTSALSRRLHGPAVHCLSESYGMLKRCIVGCIMLERFMYVVLNVIIKTARGASA